MPLNMAQRWSHAVLPLCVALALSAACVHLTPVDPVQTAIRATQVVKILDLVVDSLIIARDNGWVSQPVTKAIQDDIRAALPAIQQSPDGAVSSAIGVLEGAQQRVGSEHITKYLQWGVTALQALP